MTDVIPDVIPASLRKYYAVLTTFHIKNNLQDSLGRIN